MPELPLRKRLIQARKKRQTRQRFGPVSGFRWLRNVENVYRARAVFLEKHGKETPRQICLMLGLREYLGPKQIETARIESSKTTPAINIFIERNIQRGKFSGMSITIPWGKLGLLYCNILSKKELPSTKYHEEEHTRTKLMRKKITDFRKITNLGDIKENLLQETIAYLSDHITISTRSSYLIGNIRSEIGEQIERNLDVLLSNRPAILFEEFNWLDSSLRSEAKKIIDSIENSLKELTPQEILLVLRQTTWDKIPQALEERIRLKQYYLAKRLRKRRPQK